MREQDVGMVLNAGEDGDGESEMMVGQALENRSFIFFRLNLTFL